MFNETKLKAVVLCAGRGTRLQPITHTRPKQLIPIGNKYIIEHILDKIASAGIKHTFIVVSPRNHNLIEEIIGDGSRWSMQVEFIEQITPLGIAHAVNAVRVFIGEDDFLLYLGDNLIEGDLTGLINSFLQKRPDASILLKEVSQPQRFGVALLDSKGNITQVFEKPKEPPGNLGIPGIYLFKSSVFDSINRIKPSPRGELEITDAIQEMLRQGKVIHSYIHKGWWFDAGNKDDLLEANKYMLNEQTPYIKCTLDKNTITSGNVFIDRDVNISDSIIKGPVSIACGCQIKNCSIGPNVSLSRNCEVNSCTLTDSIIMDRCKLTNVNISESVLGGNVNVCGLYKSSNVLSLFMGDDSVIEIK